MGFRTLWGGWRSGWGRSTIRAEPESGVQGTPPHILPLSSVHLVRIRSALSHLVSFWLIVNICGESSWRLCQFDFQSPHYTLLNSGLAP